MSTSDVVVLIVGVALVVGFVLVILFDTKNEVSK